MAVLYGTQSDGSLIPVQADAQGRLVAELAAVDQAVQGDLMVTGDVQMASLNGSQLAGVRNQLINGDFRVWQRNTTNAVNAYGADRWYTASSDVQMTSDNARPFGLSKSIRLWNINSSTTSLSLRQAIELPFAGHPSVFVPGTVWTASIYLTSSAITPQFNLSFTQGITGTTSGGVNPTSIGDMALVETVSGQLGGGAAQTWYRFARTFTVDASAAPDAADLCALAAFSITDTSIKDYRIAGAQLEPGPVASPFEHRPIATELAICQRYYQRSSRNFILYPSFANDTSRYLRVPRTVVMRANPTETFTLNKGSGAAGSDPEWVRLAVTSGLAANDQCTASDYTAEAEL